MTYHITTLPKSEIEIRVRMESDQLKPFVERALEITTDEAEVEGFRKGKAPVDLVKKRVGEFKIMERAAMLAVQKTYPEIIKELAEKRGEDFEPIGSPKIEITKLTADGHLEYSARVALLPEIKLPDYKKIAKTIVAERKTPEVAEKETQETLEWLRESRATLLRAGRPAQKGDRVEIDFGAKINGVPLERGQSENHPLIIGEGKFMPGFEDQLVGMEDNEEKLFTLTAPEDYAEPALRGKTIAFTVRMRSVEKRIVPALTDEFAKSLGNFRDINDLLDNIRDGIAQEKKEKERNRIRIKIADTVAEKIEVELPSFLIERELSKMLEELKINIGRMGLGWADYLADIRKTEKELKDDWEKEAARRVRVALILRKIGRLEKIIPTEAEIQEATNQSVAQSSINPEELKKIDRAAFLEYNTTVARNEKVFNFLENLIK